MLMPVKEAFGLWMGEFYRSIHPNVPDLHEFVARGQERAMAFAPGRMVDAAEEMLASWQRNDTDQSPTRPAKLPVILVAMANDYQATGRDWARQITDPEFVIIDGDPKERVFGVTTAAKDVRAQIAVIAHDQDTAQSLVGQFAKFIDGTEQRRFRARYNAFSGLDMWFPVVVADPGVYGAEVKHEARKPVILVCDITLHVTEPFIHAPALGEPNDGKGVPGTDDPAGYPVVTQINGQNGLISQWVARL